MKILIKKELIEELSNSLEESYLLISEELNNNRPVNTGMWTAPIMEIDKVYLDKQIDGLLSVTKKLKAIKEFNRKKPL